jgi:hypothetical protein
MAFTVHSVGPGPIQDPNTLYEVFDDPERSTRGPVQRVEGLAGLPYLFGPTGSKLGPFRHSRCKYCNSWLTHENPYMSPSGNAPQRLDVAICSRCGWWLLAWAKVRWEELSIDLRVKAYESVVHNFDYQIAEEPLTALRGKIAREEVDLRSLKPRQLELVVGSVFRDYMEAEVKHLGSSGDGGIDLLLVQRDDRPVVVQVKRRCDRATESPAVVRELLGAMILQGLKRGIIATTADHFGPSSRAAVESANVIREGYEVDLYAFDALTEVVKLVEPPERPWIDYAMEHHLNDSDLELRHSRDRNAFRKRP